MKFAFAYESYYKQNRNSIQKKCKRCGHVQPGSVIMARRIPKGFRLQKHFRCVKCGAQNTAVIQG